MDYGLDVYDSACESNKPKLDRIQYQCLRLCTEALRGSSVNALQVDHGEMPLDLQRNLKQVKTSIKYNSFSDHPTRKCFEECSDLHYVVNMMIIKVFKQIQLEAKEVIASIQLPHLLLTLEDNVPEFKYVLEGI